MQEYLSDMEETKVDQFKYKPHDFDQLRMEQEKSSEFPRIVQKFLDEIEGTPAGSSRYYRWVDANLKGDEDEIKRYEQPNRKDVQTSLKEFLKHFHDFDEKDDKSLALFAAAAVHAQLFGYTPTEKNMNEVVKVLPFLRDIYFEKNLTGNNQVDNQEAVMDASSKHLDILATILEKVSSRKGSVTRNLSDLRYLKAYPKEVREWVIDSKKPVGYYDEDGYWVPIKVTPDAQKKIDYKLKQAAKQFAEERLNIGYSVDAVPIFPKDLEGKYRFGLTPEEVEEANLEEKTKRVLSFAHAPQREINSFRIQEAINKWGRFPGDTGSDEVQMAVLTHRVFNLAEHFRSNGTDRERKRDFHIMLAQRQILFNRMKSKNTEVYYNILKDLKIPDTGKTYSVGHYPGRGTPKTCNMSHQKKMRMLKGKSISQRAHQLASIKNKKRSKRDALKRKMKKGRMAM